MRVHIRIVLSDLTQEQILNNKRAESEISKLHKWILRRDVLIGALVHCLKEK